MVVNFCLNKEHTCTIYGLGLGIVTMLTSDVMDRHIGFTHSNQGKNLSGTGRKPVDLLK